MDLESQSEEVSESVVYDSDEEPCAGKCFLCLLAFGFDVFDCLAALWTLVGVFLPSKRSVALCPSSKGLVAISLVTFGFSFPEGFGRFPSRISTVVSS